MCGLFGIVGPKPLDEEQVARIHAVQRHRGPDGVGKWSAPFGSSYLTFAFERLAIIDLSIGGAQPAHSPSGSVLIFNGEIYNYLELRRELEQEGVVFRTASDSEVLMAVLDRYGIEAGIHRLNGMFAFAWRCGATGKLWVARDRVGEKPLYYWRANGRFAFASEIKTLLAAMPEKRTSPNYRVINEFLVNGVCDDGEETFFEEVRRLGPAEYAEILEKSPGVFEIRPHRYWPKPESLVERSRPLGESEEELRSLLSDAVRIRLRSDVPLGFLLSGGLDSSAIAAFAIKNGVDREQLSAFSIVNPHVASDESAWIETVTQYLKIKVNKIEFDPDGETLIKQLGDHVYYHDEPFTGMSVIAHVELMKAARDHKVTVLLSGQGGDELFCGYNKYFYFAVQEYYRRRHLGSAVGLAWSFIRNGTVLRQFSAVEASRYLPLNFPGAPTVPRGHALRQIARKDIGLQSGSVCDRQLVDLLRFSAPAINHAEDRTSMSASREVRFPFFDHRVMDFALGLPLSHKVGQGWLKRVLRLSAAPMLPPEIVWRKDKVGHFSATPSWLNQGSRKILRECLNAQSPVFQYGFLDPKQLLPRWTAFWDNAPSRFAVRHIVSILTLDLWLQKFSKSLHAHT